MIQLRTRVTVADNSGARDVSIVQVHGRGNRMLAYVGEVVTGVVKKADPYGMVKEKELVKAIIIRTKKETRRTDGSYIRFDDNAVVLIDNPKDKNPRGTRVFGPVAREVKDAGFHKIASMAEEVY